MKKKSYEASFKRLEEIMSTLENSQLGLEESLSLFKEGIELYQKCRQQLTKAEDTLQVVLAESGVEITKHLYEEMEES